jgi:SAM-dependent methyltransferase
MSKPNAKYERAVGPHKRELFSALEGTVLEIGPGAGVNLKYYLGSVRWIGIEPNPYMHPYIQREARRLGREIEVRLGSATSLGVADGSVDAVVSTLVLCSVKDPSAVVREILRVLKPGGKYVFVEHVAAPAGTWLRRIQDFIQPAWTFFADGCHPNRETWATLKEAGFARVDYQQFRAPAGLAAPHIAGEAVKS